MDRLGSAILALDGLGVPKGKIKRCGNAQNYDGTVGNRSSCVIDEKELFHRIIQPKMSEIIGNTEMACILVAFMVV